MDKNRNILYNIYGDNYIILIHPIDTIIDNSNVNIDFYECIKLLKEVYPDF